MDLLTRGSIPRHLARLSWPLMLAFGAQMFFNVVDRFFVSRMENGDAALAAMGVGFPFVALMIGMSGALAGGISSSVARAAGGGSEQDTMGRARQGFSLALVTGLSMYLLIPVALWLSRSISAQNIYDPAEYLIPVLIGAPFWTLGMQASSTIRALGTTRGPMVSMVSGLTVNAILDPIFIFGWGPIPAMGLHGAAWATVIGRAVVFGTAAYCLRGKIGWQWIGWQWDMSYVTDILMVSLPSLLSHLINAAYLSTFYTLLKGFGTVAQAVLNTVSALDQIVLFPLMGIAIAGSTVVSQNYGAGLRSRVRSSVHWTLAVTVSLAIIAGMIYYLGAHFLASLFSPRNGELHHHLVAYLHINAFALPMTIATMTVSSYFTGTGNGWPSLVINAVRTFGATIPLLWLFIHMGWELEKIWWALPMAAGLTVILALVWVESRLNRSLSQSNT